MTTTMMRASRMMRPAITTNAIHGTSPYSRKEFWLVTRTTAGLTGIWIASTSASWALISWDFIMAWAWGSEKTLQHTTKRDWNWLMGWVRVISYSSCETDTQFSMWDFKVGYCNKSKRSNQSNWCILGNTSVNAGTTCCMFFHLFVAQLTLCYIFVTMQEVWIFKENRSTQSL